jgi:hypothetical protein
MNIYFAHNGVNHATESESLAHTAEKSWPVIITVTAVAVLLMLGVTYYITKKIPKKKPAKTEEAND